MQLQDGANLGTVTFTLRVGATGARDDGQLQHGQHRRANPRRVNTVDVPIVVGDNGLVDDVNVRVRLNHTFDGDLVSS